MPLDRYGVLVGVLHDHFRDRPDDQGRWFHVNLQVDAPTGQHRCAVDVDSKQSAVGVQWRLLTVAPAALGPAPGLSPGLHDLARAPDSGALDFQRHPALSPRRGCLLGWLGGGQGHDWVSGSHVQAAEALEGILAPGRRVLVFGEPFTSGLGMHNVHQNQGDPAGSQWWDENGIWQDGATMSERADGRLDVFLSKFSTQATRTDDDGHPAPTA